MHLYIFCFSFFKNMLVDIFDRPLKIISAFATTSDNKQGFSRKYFFTLGTMSSLGTHHVQTHVMFSFSVINVWVVPNDICNTSDSVHNVIGQSSLTIAEAVLMLISINGLKFPLKVIAFLL